MRPQILAQEKVGGDAEELLGSAESASADFSQAPLMVSYFSLMKVLLCSHVDVKLGKASLCPAFMGGLSPALYRPAMLKMVKTLASTKTLVSA
jgi:hypothetical protein